MRVRRPHFSRRPGAVVSTCGGRTPLSTSLHRRLAAFLAGILALLTLGSEIGRAQIPGLSQPNAPSAPADTSGPGGNQLDQPVDFSARDSLVLRFEEGGTRAVLHGEAVVTYEENELGAYRISLSLDENRMQARGLRADTGWVGRPTFTRGQESFSGDSLAFNLQTNLGRIVEARTSFQDGWIGGETIKQAEDSVLYIDDAMYSTCSLQMDPHYHLEADRMKVVNQNSIYTGPIHLELYNIPLPIWLPFGFLPATSTRRSGILPPSYGEDQRGFFLRDWGYYWAMNPYMDFQVRFGLWTKGSWQVNPQFRYAKRYEYNGSLSLDWVRNKRGEERDPTFQVVDSRSFRWNHDQTINPTTALSADVTLSSRGYLRTVSENYDDRVRQSISSTVNFSKRWREAGRSTSVSLRQNQVLAEGNVDLTLPNISFRQQSRRPFR